MRVQHLPLLIALAATALLLSLMALPDSLYFTRPFWPLLVFGAWALRRDRTGLLAVAVITGLLQDAAHGVTLGLHSLALVVPLAILLRWRAILAALALWQSTLMFAAMSVLYVLILQGLDAVTGEQAAARLRWVALPVTVLAWPLALLLLRARDKPEPPA